MNSGPQPGTEALASYVHVKAKEAETLSQGLNSIAIPKILPSFLPSFLPNFSSKVTLKKFTKWKFGHVSKLGSKLGRIFGSAIELSPW